MQNRFERGIKAWDQRLTNCPLLLPSKRITTPRRLKRALTSVKLAFEQLACDAYLNLELAWQRLKSYCSIGSPRPLADVQLVSSRP
jgi:hypothetical protein